jgi:hypothetical protein
MGMDRAIAAPHGVARFFEVLHAGVVAGAAAGAGMLLWLMTYGLFGLGLLTPVKLIGATFYGQAALGPGLGAAIVGVILHMTMSVALGVLFAAIVPREADPFTAVLGGLVYALLVWTVTSFVLIPVANPVMRANLDAVSLPWFGAHVVYGCALGLVQQLESRAR